MTRQFAFPPTLQVTFCDPCISKLDEKPHSLISDPHRNSLSSILIMARLNMNDHNDFISKKSRIRLDITFVLSNWRGHQTSPTVVSLTHYQTTNFRIFQTERVCRRQFKIGWHWPKGLQMGRKHCGKRRNCSLRAISPFPKVFSIDLFPRGVKGVIVWEWVKRQTASEIST